MAGKKIVIVGGGLAGLVTSIHLTRSGVPCTLVEKNSYPFHRVCGEYISNEVLPYLESLGISLSSLHPSRIRELQITSVNGKAATMPLDMGGFGLSRFRFDHFLYEEASRAGVSFLLNTEAESISFDGTMFTVKARHEEHKADLVVGAIGKRSRLDMLLKRSFTQKRSPYLGVKYHVRLDSFPDDRIALHNFSDGYCGISKVEDGIVNLCYLTHRDNLRSLGNIPAMEEAVLFQNPFIREIFEHCEFLFTKPETINEISFETKTPVEQHILFAGDAAGMITPLCGNGMAIAIHSAKVLSEHILRFCNGMPRNELENAYTVAWNKLFATRLRIGRQIQHLFGGTFASNVAVNLARHVRPVAQYLVKRTHGPLMEPMTEKRDAQN